jgi:1,4-alpha-glucan branching enzyme
MGYNHIELMPSWSIPSRSRGYQVTAISAPPRVTPPEDFMFGRPLPPEGIGVS